MFCSNCGSQVADGAKFCAACLAPVTAGGVNNQQIRPQEQPPAQPYAQVPSGVGVAYAPTTQPYEQPSGAQSTQSANQPSSATQSLSILKVLGFSLIGVAALGFIVSGVYYFSVIAYYSGSGTMMPNTTLLSLILLILFAAILAVSAILHFGLASRLKKSGAVSTWCTLGGVADGILALDALFAVLLAVISTFIFDALVREGSMAIGDYSNLLIVINSLASLLVFVSGIFYLVAGISEGKTGKVNIIMVFAGLVLMIFILASLGSSLVFQPLVNELGFSLTPYYLFLFFVSFLSFIGRGLRGLALLNVGKAVKAAESAKGNSIVP